MSPAPPEPRFIRRAWRRSPTALLTVLSPGEELLVPDSVYGPTRKFCDTILKRFGVATRYYDPLTPSPSVGEKTRAILLESPGSMTMEVQDVPGICAIARERGIVTLIDNTWATPLLFPAIAAGVDITILAATKYVGGHADVMIGAVDRDQGLLFAHRNDRLGPRPQRLARRRLARLPRPQDHGGAAQAA